MAYDLSIRFDSPVILAASATVTYAINLPALQGLLKPSENLSQVAPTRIRIIVLSLLLLLIALDRVLTVSCYPFKQNIALLLQIVDKVDPSLVIPRISNRFRLDIRCHAYPLSVLSTIYIIPYLA